MLRPLETRTRERRSLDGLWRFRVDVDGRGRDERWWAGPLVDAREIPVPASYNDLFADAAVRNHVGDAWYQTTARIPERWLGQRIVLRFDAATHAAVVWVGDTQVAEHEGGYTPFEADITDAVEPGLDARITVVVSNVLTWHTIPPGYVVETAGGGRRQQVFHDFFNYAGLHRTVWLYTTPTTFVADVTVVTALDGATGTVHYDVATGGGGADARVAVTLRDAEGGEVARGTGARGQLVVDGVRPWRPGDGYLYELGVELATDAGEPVDTYPLPVGIRTVRVEGHRFLINDEPFYFRGFGKHEDAAVRGKAHDDVLMVHDFALMDWLGANSFRTSHYPYAEEVLEYADVTGSSSSTRHRPSASTADSPPEPSVQSRIRRSPTTPSTRRRGRRIAGRSTSSSPATRTIRVSCCGASPTSPSRSRPRRAPTSSRSQRRPAGSTPRVRSRSPTSWGRRPTSTCSRTCSTS